MASRGQDWLEPAIAVILMDEFGLIDLEHPLPVVAVQSAAKRVAALFGPDAETGLAEAYQTLEGLRAVLPAQARSLENQLASSVPH